jgi:hypothetical protein
MLEPKDGAGPKQNQQVRAIPRHPGFPDFERVAGIRPAFFYFT